MDEQILFSNLNLLGDKVGGWHVLYDSCVSFSIHELEIEIYLSSRDIPLAQTDLQSLLATEEPSY